MPVPAVTVAVKMTLWEYTDGFGEETTEVDVVSGQGLVLSESV